MKSLYSVVLFFSLINNNYAHSTYDGLIENLHAACVDTVDFLFTDILGSLRCVTVPLLAAADAFKNGMEFDGSSIPGYVSIYESDMHLKPDMNTLQIVDNKAHVICDIYCSACDPYEGDPRYLLKKQLERAKTLGYEFYVGPELEFFLLDNQNNDPVDASCYFDASDTTSLDYQKRTLINALVRNEIGVEKWHHEVAKGQHETSLHYADALVMADQIVRAKQVLKMQAYELGLRALFMPKPFFGMNGSGMHIHFSLYDSALCKNAFYEKDNPLYLSDTAHHFIAGVLKYVPAMSAICNPTVNSYKRLVAGYEAPVYVCWASKNRSALVRIPQIDATQASAARAELRSPDAMSNPYALFALLLAAGLQGIEDELELAPPVEQNLYKLSLEQIKTSGITMLPESLQDALICLSQNDFVKRALSDRFVQEFVYIKQKEVEQFNRTVTNWEWKQYASK